MRTGEVHSVQQQHHACPQPSTARSCRWVRWHAAMAHPNGTPRWHTAMARGCSSGGNRSSEGAEARGHARAPRGHCRPSSGCIPCCSSAWKKERAQLSPAPSPRLGEEASGCYTRSRRRDWQGFYKEQKPAPCSGDLSVQEPCSELLFRGLGEALPAHTACQHHPVHSSG